MHPSHAVGCNLLGFLRHFGRLCDTDTVAQRNFTAHGTAQQLIDRHAQRTARNIEQRAFDHGFGIGKPPNIDVEPRQDGASIHRIGTFQHRADDTVDQITDDIRIFAVIAAVLSSPTQDRRRFAEAANALVSIDLEYDIFTDRHL